MNFIGRMEGPEIQVELKYCERCGGLWLRPQGANGVYCAGCRVRLAALPNSGDVPPHEVRWRKGRTRGKDGRREQLHSPGRVEYLQGVAVMEVRA
jgi:hypothetical protein